jgi:hypothetical protein
MALDSPFLGHGTPGMPQLLRKGAYDEGDELDADEEAFLGSLRHIKLSGSRNTTQRSSTEP